MNETLDAVVTLTRIHSHLFRDFRTAIAARNLDEVIALDRSLEDVATCKKFLEFFSKVAERSRRRIHAAKIANAKELVQ